MKVLDREVSKTWDERSEGCAPPFDLRLSEGAKLGVSLRDGH